MWGDEQGISLLFLGQTHTQRKCFIITFTKCYWWTNVGSQFISNELKLRWSGPTLLLHAVIIRFDCFVTDQWGRSLNSLIGDQEVECLMWEVKISWDVCSVLWRDRWRFRSCPLKRGGGSRPRVYYTAISGVISIRAETDHQAASLHLAIMKQHLSLKGKPSSSSELIQDGELSSPVDLECFTHHEQVQMTWFTYLASRVESHVSISELQLVILQKQSGLITWSTTKKRSQQWVGVEAPEDQCFIETVPALVGS